MLFAAVTAAIVCVSPAYAATYDVTGTGGDGDSDLVNAVAGDTLTMNVNNSYLHKGSGDTAITNVDANIQVGTWRINNGFSGRVYSFNGAITGSGGITFAFSNVDDRGSNKSLLGNGVGNIYRFTGDVSGYSGNISSSLGKFDVEFTDSRSGSNSQSTINKTCVSGTGAISIAGELTYKVNGASKITNSALGTTGVLTFLNGDTADSTYTIGNGTAKTTVTATNLSIAEDASVILAAGSEMAVTNKINNQGSLNIDGTLVIDGITKQNETSGFGKSSTGTQGGSKNGYAMMLGGTAVIADKAMTVGEGGSIKGVASTELVDGIGFVATMQDDYGRVTDRTTFYINEGTVKLGTDGYTDYNASTYYVASNAVMDLNGNGHSYKTISLAEDATLSNTAGSFTDNSIMMENLALTGDAKLDIAKNHGLLTHTWGQTNLTLDGHTLTKTGAGTFYLVNTAVTGGGKIATTDGTLQIGAGVNATSASAKDKVTTADGVEFSVSQGAALSMVNGAQLHAKSVTGEGSISGAAGTTLKLTSDTDSSFNGDIIGGFALIKEGTGTQALNGSSVLGAITLNGGTLAIGGKTGAASLTMADNTMLEFGKAGQLTLSSSIDLSADDIKMADGITFDSTDSLTLIYMEGEGSIITFDDIDQWSSQVYTIGNKDYILELDNSGQSLVAHFKAASIPEPTTATLSLLALCGLCARRRRH